MSDRDRGELCELLAEQERRFGYKFYQYFPDTGPYRRALYPKHVQFFEDGATYKERLFMAANRVGKSESGAFEVTCHVTGLYPAWWTGRRFDHPTDWWVCGTTSETLRDIVQVKLCGQWQPEAPIGPGGMVPAHLVLHHSKRPHGLPGSLETVWVKHCSGGTSTIGLKMYEQGRKSFEGTGKHGIWCDEEPPEDCYTEMLYRTVTTKGIMLVTFTPLQGMSAVVMGFLEPDQPEARAYKMVTNAGWDDVPHLDPTEKAMLLATTPPFQKEARTKGLPQLGAGAIYQMAESDLKVKPFTLPSHWVRVFGLDAGGGAQATAVVWLALDRDTQTAYLYDCYKRETPELAVHTEAIKARGRWIPGVGDAAALIVTIQDAEQIITAYRRSGLDVVLPDKSVEAGIQSVWLMLSAARFKVFETCEAWFKEYRLYHRNEKGQIVKTNNHLMDATRYAVHSGLRRAKTELDVTALQGENEPRQRPLFAALETQDSVGWMGG
jgi:phage terminase large subunit-like protein